MANVEVTTDSERAAAGAARAPATSNGLILALACGSQFMVILDAAIVNVALPSIRHDLGFTPTGLAWVVNGYLLTFAGLMLLGGRAADAFDQRRTLIGGLFVFSVASLVSGLAPTSGLLVAARVAQGAGAAVLAPATLAVINTQFIEPRQRAHAFGAWSAAGGVGGMSGAIAGGALTTGLSWRWVFLINVPIGAALIAAAVTSLAATPTARRRSLDVVGAVLGTGGLAGSIDGVTQSANHGWTTFPVLGPLAIGVMLVAAFIAVEARVAKHPMMPLRLFSTRGVAVGDGMLLLFGAVAIAMWYFTSLLLQNVFGYSALLAGLGQTPAAVTFVLVARASSTMQPRIGVRPLILTGCGCLIAGFAWLARANVGNGYVAAVLLPTMLVAIGIGLTFPTLIAAATSDISTSDTGIIGGLANTAFQAGGSLGLAILATAADGADYDRVFFVAAGLAVAIAALIPLLSPHGTALDDAEGSTSCCKSTRRQDSA